MTNETLLSNVYFSQEFPCMDDCGNGYGQTLVSNLEVKNKKYVVDEGKVRALEKSIVRGNNLVNNFNKQ